MDLLSGKKIEEIFSPEVYSRGKSYFRNGHVLHLKKTEHGYVAKVQGSQRLPYTVRIELEDGGISGECSCPYWDDCKHFAAALLAVKENELKEKLEQNVSWKKALSDFRPAESGKAFKISTCVENSAGYPKLIVTLHALLAPNGANRASKKGVTNWYVKSLIESRITGKLINEKEKKIIKIVSESGEALGGGQYAIENEYVDVVLKELSCLSQIEGPKIRNIPIQQRMMLDKEADGYLISLKFFDDDTEVSNATVLCNSWILCNDEYRPVNPCLEKNILPFLSGVRIPKKESRIFVESYLPDLLERRQLEFTKSVQDMFREVDPRPILLLKEESEGLHGDVWFAYGDGAPQVHNSLQTFVQGVSDGKECWFRRLPQKEAAIMRKTSELLGKDFSWNNYFARKEAVKFAKNIGILDGWSINGEIKKFTPKKAEIRMRLSSGIDWFELEEAEVNGEVIPFQALADLQDNLLQMPDGSWIEFTDEQRAGLIQSLKIITKLDNGKKGYRLSKFHAPVLKKLLDVSDGQEGLKKHLASLTDFKRMKNVLPPACFKTDLRSYQREGLSWLWFLHENNFGGILADDMGLGKTIQTIALLQRSKEKEGGRSLVITPTSVTSHWVNEIVKHSNLKPALISGQERSSQMRRASKADIVILSYNILFRDIRLLSKIDWNYVILDESQKIKNMGTRTHSAARTLKSKHKLCLTGTPIENNLLELWAQFSFVMPGLLGGLNSFREEYINSGDKNLIDSLKLRISPFMLRRLKENVEKDLPPKTEEVLLLDMSDSQRAVYDSMFKRYQQLIRQSLKEKSIVETQFIVFQALLKLRLACLHPKLTKLPGIKINDSVKITTLIQRIDEIMFENHRVIVFSQFTSFLAIARKELENRKIPYCYLDGKTPQSSRAAEVERFQTCNNIPVFFLSLKAGGVGLNITAADYVIHLDPWWNPAVEDQATDRAHRIGQTKHVFVYKLIAKNSIEEKILALKEKKKQLASQVLQGIGSSKKLTKEDIQELFDM